MELLTIVHLMRHGEVNNPDGVLYGRLPDFHLTKLGQQMTAKTIDTLWENGSRWDRIVTSPLERAQESAARAVELSGLNLETEPDLIEAWNNFEGQAINSNRWALAHPKNWWQYRQPWRPSWSEPYQELALRMRNVVRKLVSTSVRHPENLTRNDQGLPVREILVVSHQSPIYAFRRFIEGQALSHLPTRRECALASLTSLCFHNRTLTGLNYTEPAADLVAQARDMVPGTSEASLNDGA